MDENGQLLNDDGTDDSNETASELRETQLTSFDISNGSELGSRRRGPSTCGSVISVETVNTSENIFKRKPSSNCGSIVSIEVVCCLLSTKHVWFLEVPSIVQQITDIG